MYRKLFCVIYATEYVGDGKAVLFVCKNNSIFFADRFYHICLEGLDENADYRVIYGDEEKTFGGDYLMNVGLRFDMGGALDSKIIVFQKVE